MTIRYRATRSCAAVAMAVATFPATALEFELGDGIRGRLSGTVTAGTSIRTEAPDPGLYGTLSGARVGAPTGQLGPNAGSSDLNFSRNAPVSTVLKGFADLELKKNDAGVFTRIMAWQDTELKYGNRAYGNVPNGFARGVPLSDNGFAREASFSKAMVTEAYVFGKLKFDNAAVVSGRIGQQTLNWGASQFIGGGINVINPLNLPASQRPGALPQEGRVPVGMASASVASGGNWGLDGFAQYEFRSSVLPGCGTFYGQPNYAATGCNFVSVLPTLNEADALAAGRYVHRKPDTPASNGGQYGVSLRYSAPELNTEFRGYAMQYHSRLPSIRVTNPNVAGGYGTLGTTRLTDPNGLKYGLIYAEDIALYGMSFDTKLNATQRLFGELAYRPNQPLNLNASDLIAAFWQRSPTSTLNLAKGVLNIAPGGSFDGYDRFAVVTGSLGTQKIFANALGAQSVVVAGEIGFSRVNGLPDPGVLRYGRSDDWGGAQAAGVKCTDTTAAQKACAYDGFVTQSAWGYRLRLAATYPGAFFGAALTPSLYWAYDANGYSYDGTFAKGRQVLRPGVRASWGKKYFAEASYTMVSGGKYNNFTDRDVLSLVVGLNF